jgi:hypothetical protein
VATGNLPVAAEVVAEEDSFSFVCGWIRQSRIQSQLIFRRGNVLVAKITL